MEIVDLHTHLLRSVDDGPSSLDEALDLARAVVAEGCEAAVATPHLSRRWPTEPGLVRDRAAELRAALESERVPLRVATGAEIELVEAQRRGSEELAGFAIGTGRWLLIEVPHVEYPFGMIETITELIDDGYRVILAHPERNAHCREDPRILERAVASGALAQVTGASLRGELGRGVARAAWDVVSRGLVHSVASDTHDTVKRPPDMGEVRSLLHDRFDVRSAATLTGDTAAAILEDATPDEVRALPVPRGRPRRGIVERLGSLLSPGPDR